MPLNKAVSELVAITARLHLDRIVKLRAHATVDDIRRRPLIRLCWPQEKDAATFDCEERCRAAARLRNDVHLGVEWVHPPGLSAEALLTLCGESGGRLMVSKLIASASAAPNPTTGAAPEYYRIRGWAFPSNTLPSEPDLHLGIVVDKRCESWAELVKSINQILGVGKVL